MSARICLLFSLLVFTCDLPYHYVRDRIIIDDFEYSDVCEPVSIHAERWYRASPPVSSDSLYFAPPAWNQYWFNPVLNDVAHRIRQDNIIMLSDAEKKQSAVGSAYAPVLRLHATPAPRIDSLEQRFVHAWAGLMYPISPDDADKTIMQSFEFFVKAERGFEGAGTLQLQMGTMREDISLNGGPPNGLPDGENSVGSSTYNRTRDLGWDNLSDEEEVYLYPSATVGVWDTLRYGNFFLGADSLDPSKDNRRLYTNDYPMNYRYACREELDGSSSGSEDINFDGTVQTANVERYYEFSLDLSDATSPFIDTTVKYASTGGWRKYKIPLHEHLPGYDDVYDSIGGPSWSDITMLRIIWTDFDSTYLTGDNSLVFWNMAFVGNEWQETGGSPRTMIRSSVINTKESADYEDYWQKYSNLIKRERDEYGYKVEQSLRLQFFNLREGDTALVEKNMTPPAGISQCDRLSLLLFGKDPGRGSPPMDEPLYEGDIRFILRFGRDKTSYFEYSRSIYPEWQNEILISIKELTYLRADALERTDAATIDIAIPANDRNEELLSIHASIGQLPDLSDIRWMAMGVTRSPGESEEDTLSGEIWVNNIKRVGNIQSDEFE